MKSAIVTRYWKTLVLSAILVWVCVAPAWTQQMDHHANAQPREDGSSEQGNSGNGVSAGMRHNGMMGRGMGGAGGMMHGQGMQPMSGHGMMGSGQNMQGMGGRGGMGAMMGRHGMGSMSPSGTTNALALPGFRGVPEVYHFGSTGFFLDHAQRLEITDQQRAELRQVQLKAKAANDAFDGQIETAEQQLWQLTGAESPDGVHIESKIRQLERLKGDQRLAFIQSIGAAAQILSVTQLRLLSQSQEP